MTEEVNGENPCKGYLRIALVYEKERTVEAGREFLIILKKIIMHEEDYIEKNIINEKICLLNFWG